MDVYASLTYRDVKAALTFLERAFGLEPVVFDDGGPEIRFAAVRHGSGMVMVQPELPDDLHGEHAGDGWVYVAVDDPDDHYRRSQAAGAELLGEPHDAMGGRQRGYSARDLEGNLWSFGTSNPAGDRRGETIGAAEDPAAIGRRLIDTNHYMTLGTAGADGRPWVSPVYYAAASYRELLWVSSPDTQHSRNLAARPQVSIVIFNSQVAIGEAQAVYMSADAEELTAAELERCIQIFSRDSQGAGARPWKLEDVVSPARHRLYRATGTETFVLDSIGDKRPGDHRIRVRL